MNNIYIIKNNGTKELFDADKIISHAQFACEGLQASASEVVMNARLKIQDGSKSSDIQNALIKSAIELIDEQNPDYDIVAGRLLNQKLRKEVYNQYEPKSFKEQVKERVHKKYYDSILIDEYTDEELDYFGSKIKYELDEQLPHISINQWYSKYLVKDNKKVVEVPQEVNMLIPMVIFAKDPNRKELILTGYKLLSQRKISLPTPIMNGVRTNFKRFISCNLIDMGDSALSLAKAIEKIMMCTASKAGIGLNASFIRGLGAEIGNPERCKHTGILPIIKAAESATGSLSQVSRGGASNLNLPFYHYEVELFSQLGDSRGTVETRARHTDQTIILNKWFLEKALSKEDIYLFHMHKVPKLYKRLGNYEEFSKWYNTYAESVPDRNKKKVNAFELLKLFLFERSITGRVYFTFADNCYKTGAFKETVYSSNLCCLAGDTMISTPTGLRMIKDIKVGDEVLTFNEGTQEVEVKKVLNSLMTSPSREVIEIEYNGRKIVCTPDHRILTKRGYVEAQYLSSDDELIIY